MGNISEIRVMERKAEPKIQKIDKDSYADLSTGEVKQYLHTESREQNKINVAQSLHRLRDLINTNVTDVQKCLWVTLTYAENMNDTKRLYDDFRKFIMRLQYYLDSQNLPKAEYIAAAEPQGRGAWHMHVILIFPQKAPFIPNEKLAKIWKRGFVKITALNNVDNVGVYLTAYLGDMELNNAFSLGLIENQKIKAIEAIDETGTKQGKAIVKGARLKLYPTGFRLYRRSKGIKDPEIIECTFGEACEVIGSAKKVFEKTIRLADDEDRTINVITYYQYNSNKKEYE